MKALGIVSAHLSHLAAGLLLGGWVVLTASWILDPYTVARPEHHLDAGPAFAVSVGVVLPYLLITVWLLPTGFAALVAGGSDWSPLVSLGNAGVLGSYVLWVLLDGASPLDDVLEWFRGALVLTLIASVLACGLAVVAAVEVMASERHRHWAAAPTPPPASRGRGRAA